MKQNIRKEIEKIIINKNLNCTVDEFKDKVDWYYISYYQKLSENFIREFKDKVDWHYISERQKLSEDFIREFEDKVNWSYVSMYQNLLEDFIREFKDRVNWDCISAYQKLSEDFIREFKDKVDWPYISDSQKLSEDFIREFKDKIYIKIQKANFKEKSYDTKLKEVKKYAKQYKLKFDGKYLYAYRDHDRNGCGQFNKTIIYEKGKYYRDWHCNMNPKEENSFGLGIFPEGNTPIKVKVEDWGVAVNRKDGKARVMGIEII